MRVGGGLGEGWKLGRENRGVSLHMLIASHSQTCMGAIHASVVKRAVTIPFQSVSLSAHLNEYTTRQDQT